MVKFTSRRLLLNFLVTTVLGYSHATDSEECLTSFVEFERRAILDNPSNMEALTMAFYKTNRPFPLSVQIVYRTNSSSNGTDSIISTDPNCPPEKEMWLWIPSPVYIFMDPTKLNFYALKTLNYFHSWSPPLATVYVPNICNESHNRFNFLNDMTMRVQTYAAAGISGEDGYLGYVLKGCGDSPLTTELPTTLADNDKGMQQVARAFVAIYLMGNLFEVILVLIVSVLYLQTKGNTIASCKMAAPPSYANYGLFWGSTVVSMAGSFLLTAHTIVIIKVNVSSREPLIVTMGWLVLALLVIVITTSLVVAVHYGRKLDLTIPSIFLLPFAILFCNRAIGISKKITQILSLWSILVLINLAFCYASYIVLALLAQPPTVISTSLLYIFVVFCTTHYLAIIFTSAKMKKNEQWKKHNIPSIVIDLVQTLMFTFIFATAFCFGLMIGAAGVLANYGATRYSPTPILSNLVTPLALAVFGWTLQKVGSQWLKLHTSASPGVEVNEFELLPLLHEEGMNNALGNLSRPMFHRRPALMGWMMK